MPLNRLASQQRILFFRPAITIFPAALPDGKSVCRIWNPQFIAYAGYSCPESDTIIGDPANADFTDICMQLGNSYRK